MQDSQRPSTVLRAEHQVILRVIGVLQRLVSRSQRGEGFELEALTRCVEFFRLFADACHHAKEEDLLFPVLEKSGIPKENGPIGVMLYEHGLARQYTKEMGEALQAKGVGASDAEKMFHVAAQQYIELLTNHIHKEDNILFNMGDQVMTDDDQEILCDKFCEVGCQAFSGKSRDDLARVADELEESWPAG